MQTDNRMRMIAIAVIAVVAAAAIAWKLLSDRPSEACRPVADFLSFNADQQKLLDSKTGAANQDTGEKATTPSDADLQTWAAGLAERADRIDDPELRAQARFAADAADRERAQIALAKSQLAADPGGSAPPPALADATQAEAEFQARIANLVAACGP